MAYNKGYPFLKEAIVDCNRSGFYSAKLRVISLTPDTYYIINPIMKTWKGLLYWLDRWFIVHDWER